MVIGARKFAWKAWDLDPLNISVARSKGHEHFHSHPGRSTLSVAGSREWGLRDCSRDRT